MQGSRQFENLRSFFRQNARTFATYAVGLLLVFQFSGFVSVFSPNIDPRSLLSNRNSDSAHIVGTAARTRWYKDNGESAYGALYYRLAHTYSFWAGRTFAGDSSEPENDERAHHLVLMTMSLISVYAIAFLLSCGLISGVAERMVATFLLVAALLSNTTWADMVFTAHPDMLFGLFVLAAFSLTVRSLREPENRLWFKLSALMWGLAGMIKLTFVIFLPPLVFLWIPPMTRERVRTTIKYFLWMLPGYLIAGFPQSFNFPRSIRFLIYQSKFSEPTTMASFLSWWKLFCAQLSLPALLVLTLLLFFSSWRKPMPWRQGLRLLPVIAFPLLMIMRLNSEVRSDYYLIPVVILVLALVVELWPVRLHLSHRLQQITLVVLVLLQCLSVGAIPKRMEANLQATLGCRVEIEAAYNEIHRQADAGAIFIADPHFPYDLTRGEEKIFSTWENGWALVKEKGANALALNVDYYKAFTDHEPSFYHKADVTSWQTVRDFYMNFRSIDHARDPDGNPWRKTNEFKCGNEIWRRDPAP